jgi:GH15 family glucan-1,4-alpha-glucosidase
MLLNHGVIGNGRLLALVNPDTSVDWLCMPRFDSASVFARLLDEDKGGTFAFVADGMRTRMAYARNTNVLRTEAETPDGRFEIYDFAPRIPLGFRSKRR